MCGAYPLSGSFNYFTSVHLLVYLLGVPSLSYLWL